MRRAQMARARTTGADNNKFACSVCFPSRIKTSGSNRLLSLTSLELVGVAPQDKERQKTAADCSQLKTDINFAR